MSNERMKRQVFNRRTGRLEALPTAAQMERLRVHLAFMAAYHAALATL